MHAAILMSIGIIIGSVILIIYIFRSIDNNQSVAKKNVDNTPFANEQALEELKRRYHTHLSQADKLRDEIKILEEANKNFSSSGKRCFIVGGDEKHSIEEFSKTLFFLSSKSLITSIETIFEHIPPELLFSKDKLHKPLHIRLLSFEIACWLHSTGYNTGLPNKTLGELKSYVVMNALELKTSNGVSMYSKNDAHDFDKFIIKYFDNIMNFIESRKHGHLSDGTGRELIEDLLDIYELSSNSVSVVDKSILTSKLNVNIDTSMASFSEGALQYKAE
jgi:hypothetical protein